MEEIRLTSSDSVFSTDIEQSIDIGIQQTTKKYMLTDVTSVVDAYNVYKKEASECNRYRLTLTIKPYCTNVLFNTCTEIVANDGGYTDSNPEHDQIIVYKDNINYQLPPWVSQNDVCGKRGQLRRAYMVENTEYSSENIGLTYYPGYDIFDNHIMRNLSFRSVIPLKDTDPSNKREIYNTIQDTMRNLDGSDVLFSPRMEYGSPNDTFMTIKHLYDIGNILSMKEGESVSVNLTNQDGWYGFFNNKSIEPKMIDGTSVVIRDDSHVINNRGNCEFIDMYPDRTLYLFNPKKNPHKRRLEKNWGVQITYPYKNFYKHNTVSNTYKEAIGNQNQSFQPADGLTNALYILGAKYKQTRNGIYGVEFRVCAKHNLSQNDNVLIYYSLNSNGQNPGYSYTACEDAYRVSYTGDMEGKYKDYYFTVNGTSVIEDIFKDIIGDMFYTQSTIPIQGCRVMNGDFTDIPQSISDMDPDYTPNVKRYFYKGLLQEPQAIWNENNTFDEIPEDVENGLQYIRVKRKDGNGYIYRYFKFDDVNNAYSELDSSFDPETEQFGNGNTYEDVPPYQTYDYIRVYSYGYFEKTIRYYEQRTDKDVVEIINEALENFTYLRFAKLHNGVKCDYYIRKFRKLPNMKFSEETLTEDIANDSDDFNKYVVKNASDDGKIRSFDYEIYPLAFSKTIYGDDITQYQFVDDIDIAHIKDNMGRPITEFFVTVIKKNIGYKDWYTYGKHSDYTDANGVEHRVEYSHCFGKVTSGFDMLSNEDESAEIRKRKRFLSDASQLTNVMNTTQSTPLESFENPNTATEGIFDSDNEFFGDIVEYNPVTAMETVLSDVNFRFNTAQRENGMTTDYTFTTHEIERDDYTLGGDFHISTETGGRDILCPEGYMYKAHYRVPIRGFGKNPIQASHHPVTVVSARPVQIGGIFIRIESAYRIPYGVGHRVFICDDINGLWYDSCIASVDTDKSFVINPIPKDITSKKGFPYIDWIDTCKRINEGTLVVRIENETIPEYAKNIGRNLFIWRNILPASESDDETLSSYTFANGSLYVDRCVNFYLRRQDPEGLNGFYYHGNTDGSYPDVEGKTIVESNYEYIPESESLC